VRIALSGTALRLARQLGLAIDQHPLAAGEIEKVDAMVATVEGERKTVMRQALGMHARTDTRPVHQADRALFQHAGPHAAENVFAARPVENDGLDAGIAEQLAEQQPRRTRTDDDDLDAHVILPHLAFGKLSARKAVADNGRIKPQLVQSEHRKPAAPT